MTARPAHLCRCGVPHSLPNPLCSVHVTVQR
jgi:hypothetical protein